MTLKYLMLRYHLKDWFYCDDKNCVNEILEIINSKEGVKKIDGNSYYIKKYSLLISSYFNGIKVKLINKSKGESDG